MTSVNPASLHKIVFCESRSKYYLKESDLRAGMIMIHGVFEIF